MRVNVVIMGEPSRQLIDDGASVRPGADPGIIALQGPDEGLGHAVRLRAFDWRGAGHETDVAGEAACIVRGIAAAIVGQPLDRLGELFTAVLLREKIAISVDGKGCWPDNVFVERLWRSVKYEEVYLNAYASVTEAHAGIGRYIGILSCREAALRAWRSHARPGIRRPAASRSGMINQRQSTYPSCEPVQTSRATSGDGLIGAGRNKRSGAIRQAFLQPDHAAARRTWHHVTDQLRGALA